MAQKQNQANKMLNQLRNDENQWAANLNCDELKRHLIHEKGSGFNIDGSYNE